ncbi:CID1p [Coprinopsis cinerea okayama7|uniref:polynucleotide adenylyltransferase n=1 Tax=Coprinopsis cinerea (strain Okayama-7 / 130 / ATCC MYA-4618 / FGSC 9003) TaxID=240176 RepID=D6RPX6_COPC7|nr:CID1p [Coprinopsis cinerea okayama7\|eukprot:XP_002910390.1 CID1p [Coprinopsis cinerea okayama7\
MAYSQSLSPSATYRDVNNMQSQPVPTSSVHSSPVIQAIQHPRQASKQRFVAELSQCLFDFVIQLLPTQEEMAVKEDVRKLLERLIRTIEPDSRLLSFGSTANGFSLRNSDMDLCCLIDSDDKLSAADLVTMLGDLLERETKFHVKPLPHARIPIVKLTLDPSPGLPHGIACDIGFENRLALENTRLLMCYAMIDPTRVRTMVLFLKVWSKRRKINSPYKGTLSSYGYVLLVIYFLVHVKNPPVLPNLQQMPPLRPITTEETHLNGHNIWFFDDIDLLRQRWRSENTESVAELYVSHPFTFLLLVLIAIPMARMIDFFRYFARDFQYNNGVASIRAGLLKKDAKGWQSDQYSSRYDPGRERNRLCIEDPFELDYNVARCVTKDGLYTIRGEFMRASRILAARPERAIVAIAELCEERKDEELVQAPTYSSSRPSPIPPQTPYTVGSNSLRPKNAPPERLSPPTQFFEPAVELETKAPHPQVPRQPPPPPEHMAPKRSKWTSPPPPDAPSVDHTLFQSQFDKSLELATAPTEAREKEASGSETNSDIFTDEDRSDAAESDDISSDLHADHPGICLLADG